MTIDRIDASVAAPRPSTPTNIQQAAEQFESLLIAQMLKAARGDEGWLGTGEDSTAESALGLAEEQFAAALAAQGGLGLSQMIAGGLKE